MKKHNAAGFTWISKRADRQEDWTDEHMNWLKSWTGERLAWVETRLAALEHSQARLEGLPEAISGRRVAF